MIKMKNSGVDWIGDIPMDWNLVQTKRYFRNKKQIVGSAVDEYERLALTLNGVVKRSKDDNEGLQPEKFEGYQILCKNEIVFKLIDLENVKTSRVGLSPFTGLVSPAYIVISNNSEDNRFYYYWFMFMYYNEVFNHLGGAGVRSALNAKDVMMLPIPDIDSSLQKRIADYLDNKCAKIDEIIEKQQAVIEKLKEYKLSVITEAVTKGLNPDAEMRDSGIEWIETIPVHWKSIKLKYCTYIRARLGWKGLKADEYVEKGYPLLSAFNIVNSKLDFENNINYINEFRYDESPEIKLSIDDILLVKDGAGIGKCAIVEQLPIPSTTNGSLAVITTDDKLSAKFLYYFFLSNVFQKYIDRIKDGMGVPHLFQSDLREIAVVVPSISEQNLIVTKLNEITERLDISIRKKEKIIEKLQEYKKSLIYEVVTGKKEV